MREIRGGSITLRLTLEQRERWEREAKLEGRDLSGWMRRVCDLATGGRAEKREERAGTRVARVEGKVEGAVAIAKQAQKVFASCPHGKFVGERCSLCIAGGGIVQQDGTVR